MWKFCLLLLVLWIALMPPFFTDGACTAEFDAEAKRLDKDMALLATPALAAAYWKTRQIGSTVTSGERCRAARPAYVERCTPGSSVYSTIPVVNRVCSFYRDDMIKILLQYDNAERLMRVQTDMKPYKSLPLPLTGKTVYWAR
jgi:hypothetical protein